MTGRYAKPGPKVKDSAGWGDGAGQGGSRRPAGSKAYDLVSETTLVASADTWSAWDGQTDFPGSGAGTNALTDSPLRSAC